MLTLKAILSVFHLFAQIRVRCDAAAKLLLGASSASKENEFGE